MRVISIVLGTTLAGITSLQAQIPGGYYESSDRIQARFIQESLREVTAFLVKWREVLATDDAKKLSTYFTVDGFFAPSRGETVQGRRNIQTQLEMLLPVTEGFHTTLVDFSVSGAMAYQYGRYTQAITDQNGIKQPDRGTYVLVLYREGRDWKIRSYVERSDSDPV